MKSKSFVYNICSICLCINSHSLLIISTNLSLNFFPISNSFICFFSSQQFINLSTYSLLPLIVSPIYLKNLKKCTLDFWFLGPELMPSSLTGRQSFFTVALRIWQLQSLFCFWNFRISFLSSQDSQSTLIFSPFFYSKNRLFFYSFCYSTFYLNIYSFFSDFFVVTFYESTDFFSFFSTEIVSKASEETKITLKGSQSIAELLFYSKSSPSQFPSFELFCGCWWQRPKQCPSLNEIEVFDRQIIDF